MTVDEKQLYYRLIALWAVCEGVLGGIIHGINLPVSGLINGGSAVIIVCLIAYYVPQKGAIIKATIIVAIFKMMLSPHSPLPAYFAVFFQGITGELLFSSRKHYKFSCIFFAPLALVESALQRILTMTILYGMDFWKAVNAFISGISLQQSITNYSLYLAGGYVFLHLVAGISLGWIAGKIPGRVKGWRNEFLLELNTTGEQSPAPALKKKGKMKIALFVVWILLACLWLQAELKIGDPLIPSNVAAHIILRSVLIIMTWYFLISPVITYFLNKWLLIQRSKSQQSINEILRILPQTQLVVNKSWQYSSNKKGLKRLNKFLKTVLVNSLDIQNEKRDIFILAGPIQSGKTTRLIKWLEGRDNIHGILTPIIDGQRVFMNAATKEIFPMEAEEGESNILTAGRYTFSKHAFDWAKNILLDGLNQKNSCLIIDEIGLLELKSAGFSDVLKKILSDISIDNAQSKKQKLIVVIRESLLKEVLLYFGIKIHQQFTEDLQCGERGIRTPG